MNEVIYFENHCESCGGGVEFPANGVGEQIPCPHCQRLIAAEAFQSYWQLVSELCVEWDKKYAKT
jgi:uncharacterized paraquat-inducible protein A